jgi:hypothetical protein
MNDEQRRAIAEARATIARVDSLTPRDETEPQRNPGTVSSDRMMRWRADMERQGQAFAKARAKREREENDERNNSDEWNRWINDTIAASVLHCARTLAEAMRDEIATLRDELATRDRRIDGLERLLSQQAVTTARLEVRVLEGVAARESRVLDLPNPLRKGLN